MSNTNPYQASSVGHAVMDGDYIKPTLWTSQGRLNRVDYFTQSIALSVALFIIFAIIAGVGAAFEDSTVLTAIFGFLFFAAAIVALPVAIMIGIKRLHDMNQTGWLWLLNLVPIVSFFFGLYMLFAPGTQGPNRFGPAPPASKNTVLIIVAALLILIVVVSILAAIALPMYSEFVQRAAEAGAAGQ